ncbi:MAG TPA: hypothetical protein PLV21_14080 [Cyclobacteriaceae bacterium]|nr:hypothetical protein [Cyclobacteriaceae bacterium]HRJ83014.1 hypothetical protein [Cyclobacteriaceae bacterium]
MANWLNASRKAGDADTSDRMKKELDERDKKFKRAGFLIAMEGLFLTTGLLTIALLFL